MGQKSKLCSQLNKSSTQITGSSAQLRASEFGPVIEGPILIKLFIFSLKHSSASVKCAKKTQKLSTTEVILKFNNALNWHREDSQSYLETMAWSSTAAREFTVYDTYRCAFHWDHVPFSYAEVFLMPHVPMHNTFNLAYLNLTKVTVSYMPKFGNAQPRSQMFIS